MSEQKAFLEQVHIKNFLSLRNVTLPFKPLTVLVGPNASGKSNVLSALELLSNIAAVETPPTVEVIQNRLWAGGTDYITFQLHTKVEETTALYELKLNASTDNRFFSEKLSVNNVQVISITKTTILFSSLTPTNKDNQNQNHLLSKSDVSSKMEIFLIKSFSCRIS